MAKPSKRQRRIERAFQDAWEEFGDDVSTEFLIGITSDRCDAEYEDVVDALVAVAKSEEAR